jgi:hypothetical protein
MHTRAGYNAGDQVFYVLMTDRDPRKRFILFWFHSNRRDGLFNDDKRCCVI